MRLNTRCLIVCPGPTPIIIAILIIATGLVKAQDSIYNSLGIRMGASNIHILDEHAAYMIFRGTGVAPGLVYNRKHFKNNHILEGSFYHNKISSYTDNFRTKIFAGSLRYAYFRTIHEGFIFKNGFEFDAGISLTSFFMKSDYEFDATNYWGKAIESWYGSHSVDAAALLRYSWKKRNEFRSVLYIPVFSNLSRPAYSSSGDYNYEKVDWDVKYFGKNLFIIDHPVFNVHLSYMRQLGEKFHFETEYEFYYTGSCQPELMRMFINVLRIGIEYQF